MNSKSILIKSMDDAGIGLAQIATLSAVDHDGDTYERGAFSWGGDQWVMLLPAHDRRAMPFGKARVYEEGDHAYAELHLNLETEAGREWHAALKFDLAKGKAVQEWSYGYQIHDMDYVVRGEVRVRVLKKVEVDEVSTVLRGAGAGTRTVAIKSLALLDQRFKAITAELAELTEAVGGDPAILSATGRKQLAAINLAVDALLAAGGEDIDQPDAAAQAKAVHAAVGGYLAHTARRHLPNPKGA